MKAVLVFKRVSLTSRSAVEKSSFNIYSPYRAVCACLEQPGEMVIFINVQFPALTFLLRSLGKQAEEEEQRKAEALAKAEAEAALEQANEVIEEAEPEDEE